VYISLEKYTTISVEKYTTLMQD